MNPQLLWDGLKAMILGMGMVYLFLIIMIWIMKLTSKLLKPYAGFLEPKTAAPKTRRSAASSSAGLTDNDLARAVADAVQKYHINNHTGKPENIDVQVNGKTINVKVAPAGYKAPAESAVAAPAVAKTAESSIVDIKSPLPGTMIKIAVNIGDQIAVGDVIAVIEAMKMETEIRSDISGTVHDVLVASKDVVAAEQILFQIEVTK